MNTQNVKSQFVFHINRDYRESPLAFGDIRLIQLGRLFCLPTTVISTHVHMNWYELTVVTDGKGKVEVNGEFCPVQAGDIVLSLPCDSHAVYSDEEEPLKYDFFSFYCEDEEKKALLEKLHEAVYPAAKRTFRSEKIPPLIATAIEELEEAMPDCNQLLTAIFQQIFLYLTRLLKQTETPVYTHRSEAELLCFKVIHYLDTHVYTLKNLYELADVTNYNYSYLSALFKGTTGISIAEYFRAKKLKTAKQLLSEGKLKIKEISQLLNYSSIYAFSKAYKAHYGVPPSRDE